MRNISFALTTRQFYRRQKTVTRRLGWANVKPGELLCGVEKGMGLAKGESPIRLHIIRVKSSRREFLRDITPDDVEREGFPLMSIREFVHLFRESHESCDVKSVVTRIEFEFIPGGRFLVSGFCRVCGCSEFDACEPDVFGETCRWATDSGHLTAEPTTLCSRCSFVDRFSGQ